MKHSLLSVAVALVVAAACTFMPTRSSAAEVQLPTSYFVLTVEMEVIPGQIEAFKKAIEENSAASIKEPGCRQFHVVHLASDPNRVFLYEVYDDEAAFKAHRATEHFKKFDSIRNKLIVKSEVKTYKPIVLHEKK
jgi:autoinducer 2-degrading protein